MKDLAAALDAALEMVTTDPVAQQKGKDLFEEQVYDRDRITQALSDALMTANPGCWRMKDSVIGHFWQIADGQPAEAPEPQPVAPVSPPPARHAATPPPASAPPVLREEVPPAPPTATVPQGPSSPPTTAAAPEGASSPPATTPPAGEAPVPVTADKPSKPSIKDRTEAAKAKVKDQGLLATVRDLLT